MAKRFYVLVLVSSYSRLGVGNWCLMVNQLTAHESKVERYLYGPGLEINCGAQAHMMGGLN